MAMSGGHAINEVPTPISSSPVDYDSTEDMVAGGGNGGGISTVYNWQVGGAFNLTMLVKYNDE